MNIQGTGLDLIRNPDKLYDWMGLKQSPGKVETTQTTKAPFAQKPKKEKDLFLEGFYSVADKPKEERRSYTSPFAKSRAILDSISQTKPAKRVEEEDDFLKGFYSVADRPKEETPIGTQLPTVQKNTQTTYKPGDWIRSTMTKPSPYVILSEVEESQKDKKPNLWYAKNTDLSPQKVNYASSINARMGESRDEYDSRIRQQYAARRQAEEDNQRELLQSTWDDMQAGYKLGDWMRRTTTQPNKPFYQSEYSNTDIGFEYPQEKHYVEDVPVSDVMYGSNSGKGLDTLSNFLTAASLIPGVDTFADLVAIPVDLMRDDYLSAGLDLVGAVPFVGEVAELGKYAKIADDVSDAAKLADNVADAKKTSSVKELISTQNLTRSKKEFTNLLDDIRKNGIKEPIKYVEYNGKKYVVDGNHRLYASKILGLKNIPSEKVSLPYKGYHTFNDLFWKE